MSFYEEAKMASKIDTTHDNVIKYAVEIDKEIKREIISSMRNGKNKAVITYSTYGREGVRDVSFDENKMINRTDICYFLKHGEKHYDFILEKIGESLGEEFTIEMEHTVSIVKYFGVNSSVKYIVTWE